MGFRRRYHTAAPWKFTAHLINLLSASHSRKRNGQSPEADVVPSLRRDRSGQAYLRFSPHFYNTESEIDRVIDLVRMHAA